MLARYLPLYVLVQSYSCYIIETKMKIFLDIETKHFNNAEMLGGCPEESPNQILVNLLLKCSSRYEPRHVISNNVVF